MHSALLALAASGYPVPCSSASAQVGAASAHIYFPREPLMPFTVEDFQDLIRLLAQHPEWQAELRRHVLSDELLELPALVRQLAEQLVALTARVDQLVEAQARTEQRLQELAHAQARTEQRLERLEAIVTRLAEAQERMEVRLGRVEGDVLELRYERRAPAYLGRLARRLRVLDPGALADLLDAAVEEGRLSIDEREAVLLADLVLSGRHREDDSEVYLLAEVSAGVGLHDVERATERAAILQKLGRPVMPIVAGRQIIAQAASLARERGGV